ncbi:glycoside hydrolase domain-containing protein [Streptomyces sp. NPDC005907]|uniref:glycoside hydrolase domain-containing protein n=1 Tax=Streptomyces sp. NPDC005907 TaxID=3154571 RepID=UPI0033E277CC
MADEMVLRAQKFVNSVYSGKIGMTLDENGRTGWPVMYALTRALQYELGITSLSNSFGATTLSTLQSKWPKLNESTMPSADFCRIIQSALYCKGYDGGDIDGKYSSRVASSVSRLKAEMGVDRAFPGSDLTPKVFKGLLNMDAYVVVNGGADQIREVQRWLNGRYVDRRDFFIVPCDGHHSRDVAKSLLFAIQYELGMADGTANGVFGPGTQTGLKSHTVAVGTTGTWSLLFSAAMILSRRTVPFGNFTGEVRTAVQAFQAFAKLSVTGLGDFQTWASLLVSTGDPERKGTACDGVTKITAARAKTLKDAGYLYLGRYLTNPDSTPSGDMKDKEIQPGELQTIADAGMRVYPIYQTFGRGTDSFSVGQGTADALAAVNAAVKHGFKPGTRIYFAVDYDAVDDEVTSYIIPHFEGVNDGIESAGGQYKVGIYGPRNVCSRVSERKLADASFVSDMSTGFSGNLGYPLPNNWAFDQIKTITIGSGDGAINIDNNIASGIDVGQNSFNPTPSPTPNLDVRFENMWWEDLRKDIRAYMESVDVPESNWYTKWTTTECIDYVLSWDSVFTDLARRLKMRKALIQIPVLWEMRHYNISKILKVDDRYSDAAVYQYHTGQLPDWWPDAITESMRDSSTGLAQIFGLTAIKARNLAVDLGLLSGTSRRNPDKDNELFEIWNKLRTNNSFTMATVPYVHMYHASLINVPRPGLSTSDADTEQILIRYQGTTTDAEKEGKKRMGLYRVFEKYYAPIREHLA